MQVVTRGLILFVWLLGSLASLAQVAISGQVFDRDGTPLPGVNVYLAGSTVGGATDSQGRFRIENVHPGVHRVRASMVGFELGAHDIVARPGSTHTLRFDLEPVDYHLGDVVVRPMDGLWQRRLNRFTTILIGQSSFADEVVILNPEVLDFSDRFGRLTAVAHAPLRIRNRALGYLVHYDLTHFEATSRRVRYDGDPFFEVLIPANPAEAARWERNRAKAYAGSQTHLLRAMLAGNTEEQGFALTHMPSQGPAARGGFTPISLDPVQRQVRPEALLRRLDDSTTVLAFRGQVVIHFDEREDEGIVRWDWNVERVSAPRPFQVSKIYLENRSVVVDDRGELADPFGMTRQGYLAFRRLAMMLPVEYGL
jgi:hypothetical protein